MMAALKGVENDNSRENYVPSFFKNFCLGIKTLNYIESGPVKVFHDALGEEYEAVDSSCL